MNFNCSLGALKLAEQASRLAGVEKLMSFSIGDVSKYSPRLNRKNQIVVTNPPWDVRLEGGIEAWQGLGDFGRRELKGSRIWALSGNPDITRNIRLKSSMKIPLNAASVDLRFLRYDVRGD